MELPLQLDFQMESPHFESGEAHARRHGSHLGVAAQPGRYPCSSAQIDAETRQGQHAHPAGDEGPDGEFAIPGLRFDSGSALNQAADLEGEQREIEVVADAEDPSLPRAPRFAARARLDHGLSESGSAGEQNPGDDERVEHEPSRHAASILTAGPLKTPPRSLPPQIDTGTIPDRIASRLALRSPRRLELSLRAAAILVPLVAREDDYRLVLTRRARDLRRQPGQIAFPGGMVEPGDASELAAALRESQEEIGLDPSGVRVLGRLDDRLTVQGFRLIPFVALVPQAADISAGPEVDLVFEVPLRTLLLPGCETTEIQRFPEVSGRAGGKSRVVFRYRYLDHDIWGLTARVIRDLLDVL